VFCTEKNLVALSGVLKRWCGTVLIIPSSPFARSTGHHKKNQYGSFHESYEEGCQEGRYEKGDEEVRQEVQEIIF